MSSQPQVAYYGSTGAGASKNADNLAGCSVDNGSAVIPKDRVFSSGPRDLPTREPWVEIHYPILPIFEIGKETAYTHFAICREACHSSWMTATCGATDGDRKSQAEVGGQSAQSR
jgi:hypothetical protein